jgi:hypothetical protein
MISVPDRFYESSARETFGIYFYQDLAPNGAKPTEPNTVSIAR